jgi:hypothetical protein
MKALLYHGHIQAVPSSVHLLFHNFDGSYQNTTFVNEVITAKTIISIELFG